MKTRSIFWGSLFILAGALLLASNLGILRINVWQLIWPSFIIAMGVWTLWTATQGAEALEVEDISVPLEAITRAKMTVSFGAGQVRVDNSAAADSLFSGRFVGGLDHALHRQDDTVELELKPASMDFVQVAMPWAWGAREWKFGLNDQVEWHLNLEIGASNTYVDLRDLRVVDLNIDTGASNTEVTLPANAGHTHVDVDGGAASITLTIPDGVAARIQIDSGLAAISVNRERFPRMGEVYKSGDYETAVNKVDINADIGAGSLNIR
ncbi:MAG: cell wall-active antibiotics response protein [Anaerolineales bacterium]|nr:cell wall-active antibiotics response protein [Anaerolineales bacterium]